MLADENPATSIGLRLFLNQHVYEPPFRYVPVEVILIERFRRIPWRCTLLSMSQLPFEEIAIVSPQPEMPSLFLNPLFRSEQFEFESSVVITPGRQPYTITQEFTTRTAAGRGLWKIRL
jgi:hypothetical protein